MRRDLLPSLARAVIVIAAAYFVLYVAAPAVTRTHPVDLLNRALAVASAGLLNAIGFVAMRRDTVVSLNGASVIVTNDCNGLGAMLLVTGAISAVPSVAWTRRLLGIAFAASAVTAVNILRISALCYLHSARQTWFDVVHQQVAPLFIVLVSVACFVLWLRRIEFARPA